MTAQEAIEIVRIGGEESHERRDVCNLCHASSIGKVLYRIHFRHDTGGQSICLCTDCIGLLKEKLDEVQP